MNQANDETIQRRIGELEAENARLKDILEFVKAEQGVRGALWPCEARKRVDRRRVPGVDSRSQTGSTDQDHR